MASANDEGPKFPTEISVAPLADEAAGVCGETRPSAQAPAAIPTGQLKAAIQRLNALTERMNDKPRI